LDAQFRCKCGKPMPSANGLCSDCGSLGPHIFTGNTAAPVEPSDMPRGARHRESYTPEFVERPQPASRPERYVAPPPEDIPPEPRHASGRMHDDDDSRFPVGMRSHSPILDHIRDLDNVQTTSKKHTEKERPRDYGERDEEQSNYSYSGDEDREQEQPEPAGNGGIVSIIASVVLMLALVIAAIYVINNYDEISRWLASPTVPEIFKPSAE
jgi:hypothetical protein